ncbi:MAG: DUF4931 domain-containing protein [Candidatus Micrarchaeota archaeon]
MTLEFRKDEIRGGVVVMADERAKRPTHGKSEGCPFCRGNEKMTPPTVFALPSAKNWRTRVFQNLYSALKRKGRFAWKDGTAPAFGDHEVIVETPRHAEQFQDYSDEQLMLLWETYRERYDVLRRRKDVKCVFIFKNHGPKSGASIGHEHSQVTSWPFVPEMIAKEAVKSKPGHCAFCKLMKEERKNALLESKDFMALCPSFARFPCETWVIAKRHKRSIRDFDDDEAQSFMLMLQECVRRISSFEESYNIAIHSAPRGLDFHVHAEIYPRKPTWGAIELGAGPVLNTTTEKGALAVLRK